MFQPPARLLGLLGVGVVGYGEETGVIKIEPGIYLTPASLKPQGRNVIFLSDVATLRETIFLYGINENCIFGKKIGEGNGMFAGKAKIHLGELDRVRFFNGALRLVVEVANGVDLVAKKLDANGAGGSGWPAVEDSAAQCGFALEVDLDTEFIPGIGHPTGQFVERMRFPRTKRLHREFRLSANRNVLLQGLRAGYDDESPAVPKPLNQL
jgi:hypothetical protein